MRNSTRVLQSLGVAVALLSVSSVAAAQSRQNWTDWGFASFSLGVQPASRTHTVSGSFDLYDEQATFDASLGTGSSSLVDLMGGARVWRNVGVALGYSRYSDTVSTIVNARIPDPLFFDAHHGAAVAVDDLAHREGTVHLSAVYVMPLVFPRIDMVEVMVYAGPSFFSLSKDVVQGYSVAPGTSDIDVVDVAKVSGNGTGIHFGVDVRYPVTKNIGAGLFLRRAAGSVDIPEVDGGSVDVGGASFGVGVRVRF